MDAKVTNAQIIGCVKRIVALLSLLAVFLAGCFEGQPRHHVSSAEQKTLPTEEFFLGDALCPAKYVPGTLARVGD